MFFKLRGGHTCFSHAYIGLPHVTREMHLSFENNNYWRPKSISINTTQQHNTSLRSILEDDSISSTSRTRICSCLGKGARLWLVTKPSIYSFRIAHFTFTFVLFFRLDLIQPLASNLLTCECRHELDVFGMHLIR